MNECKTFVWYTSWRYCLEALERDERLDVIEALWDYIESDTEPALAKAPMVAFRAIRKQIDIAREKHEGYRETKRRAARSRWHKEGDAPQTTDAAPGPARQPTRNAPAPPAKAPSARAEGTQEAPKDGEMAKEVAEKAKEAEAPLRRKGGKKEAEAIPYEEIHRAWREICLGLPQPKMLTDGRKRRMAQRVAEMGGADKALPLLRELMQRMNRSSFLQGNNRTGWKASFDWLFENSSNWVKVMEGNYDDAPAAATLPQQMDSNVNLPTTYTHGNNEIYGSPRANCRVIDADAARKAEFARHIFEKLNGPERELPDLDQYY